VIGRKRMMPSENKMADIESTAGILLAGIEKRVCWLGKRCRPTYHRDRLSKKAKMKHMTADVTKKYVGQDRKICRSR
jgi:hypothetical protein